VCQSTQERRYNNLKILANSKEGKNNKGEDDESQFSRTGDNKRSNSNSRRIFYFEKHNKNDQKWQSRGLKKIIMQQSYQPMV
jgi:hypothetical protein